MLLKHGYKKTPTFSWDVNALFVPFCQVSLDHINHINKQMKSFIAKRVNSILVNWWYLRFKLLKYNENNKKICNTFDHNFKYTSIPLYIIERYYFVLYNGVLTLKMSKMELTRFAIKLFKLLS